MIPGDDLRYVEVWFRDETSVRVVAEDEPRLDADYAAYLESGRTRDRLMLLTKLGGDLFKVATSDVHSWVLSTPAGRAGMAELDARLEEERKERRGWDDE